MKTYIMVQEDEFFKIKSRQVILPLMFQVKKMESVL